MPKDTAFAFAAGVRSQGEFKSHCGRQLPTESCGTCPGKSFGPRVNLGFGNEINTTTLRTLIRQCLAAAETERKTFRFSSARMLAHTPAPEYPFLSFAILCF